MSQLFQFKVQLKNIKPSICRTVIVPDSTNFFQLHNIIQIAMGWLYAYSFTIKTNQL